MLSRVLQRLVASRRILVTGAGGQVGQELVVFLQNKYGVNNILATDIVDKQAKWPTYTREERLDVLDFLAVDHLVGVFRPHRIYHLASMLSARSEETPLKALKVNVVGAQTMLEVSRKHEVSLYCASTLAAFGPSSPKVVSAMEIMRPTTMYGITKIHMELLGEYYCRRYQIDFRCSRIPVVNSEEEPGGGSAAFTVRMFYDLFRTGKTVIPVGLDAKLPIMYLPDLVRSLDDIMEAPKQRFTARVYTLDCCSVTVGDYVNEVQKLFPTGQITVEPDFRDAIIRSWPHATNASLAARDWGHRLFFSLPDMIRDMHTRIQARLQSRSGSGS